MKDIQELLDRLAALEACVTLTQKAAQVEVGAAVVQLLAVRRDVASMVRSFIVPGLEPGCAELLNVIADDVLSGEATAASTRRSLAAVLMIIERERTRTVVGSRSVFVLTIANAPRESHELVKLSRFKLMWLACEFSQTMNPNTGKPFFPKRTDQSPLAVQLWRVLHSGSQKEAAEMLAKLLKLYDEVKTT